MLIVFMLFFNELVNMHIVVNDQTSLDKRYNYKQEERLATNGNKVFNQRQEGQQDEYDDALKQGTCMLLVLTRLFVVLMGLVLFVLFVSHVFSPGLIHFHVNGAG
jgi:small-conductance mechanosensitive channel